MGEFQISNSTLEKNSNGRNVFTLLALAMFLVCFSGIGAAQETEKLVETVTTEGAIREIGAIDGFEFYYHSQTDTLTFRKDQSAMITVNVIPRQDPVEGIKQIMGAYGALQFASKVSPEKIAGCNAASVEIDHALGKIWALTVEADELNLQVVVRDVDEPLSHRAQVVSMLRLVKFATANYPKELVGRFKIETRSGGRLIEGVSPISSVDIEANGKFKYVPNKQAIGALVISDGETPKDGTWEVRGNRLLSFVPPITFINYKFDTDTDGQLVLVDPNHIRVHLTRLSPDNLLQIKPTRLEIIRDNSNLDFDAHSSLSPSGLSRLVRTKRGNHSIWCLEREEMSYTLSTEICELHGKQPVGWRPDELAVVLRGRKKETRVGDTSMNVGFAVLDFKSGRVVEIDTSEYRLLPAWSPNGKWVFAMRGEHVMNRVILDPTTQPISDSERPVDELDEKQNLLPWLTTGRKGQGVLRMNLRTYHRERISGGVFRQDIEDQSSDGRFCLTSDNGVSHGRGDDKTPPWNVFDYDTRKCIPLPQPPNMTSTVGSAQISDDGKSVIAIWRVKNNDILGSISVSNKAKPNDWKVLHKWGNTDIDRPFGSVLDGQLRWNGMEEGWLISKSGLLQLRFFEN